MNVRTGSHISSLIAGASYKRSCTISASKSSGQVFTFLNPEDTAVIVTRTILHVKTGASAACTLDVGVAASGSTSADNLMDGVSVNTAANTIYDNIENQGTNGVSSRYLPAGSYITASVASGNANGLVADLYVNIQPLTGS